MRAKGGFGVAFGQGMGSTLRLGVVLLALAALAGCKSAYVEADVLNDTAAPVTLVELDYPSASFGVETLAAGATYHYRFKILGSGATKLLWTSAANVARTANGPELHEGQQGTLTVRIEGDAAQWKTKLY